MNWKPDLDQLAEELPRRHLNLFDFMTRQEFQAEIDKLKREESKMNPYSMVIALSKLIAMAGDAHTALEIPKSNMVPFTCYWFEEGIYITGGVLPDINRLNHKILAIEGVPISEIIDQLIQVIPHENLQFVKSQVPLHLMCTDILYGLGVVAQVEEIGMTLEGPSGSRVDLTVPSVKYRDWEKIRTRNEEYYSLEKMEADKTLYVHYDRCQEMEKPSMEDFIREIKGLLEIKGAYDTLVLDFRYNRGGNSELFRPFIEWLGDFEKSHLALRIVVVVGRDTFSSALLNVFSLQAGTKATFIGEPTGGKPNCYGEVQYFQLRKSGLSVRYSTKYYYLLDDYQIDSFYPLVHLAVRFSDYGEKRDPCLAWICAERVGKNE